LLINGLSNQWNAPKVWRYDKRTCIPFQALEDEHCSGPSMSASVAQSSSAMNLFSTLAATSDLCIALAYSVSKLLQRECKHTLMFLRKTDNISHYTRRSTFDNIHRNMLNLSFLRDVREVSLVGTSRTKMDSVILLKLKPAVG
jgi:hypothetical protein